MASETGQRVGDYEVLALLGSGGMGRVYKVRNVISNREEAMKILLPDFAAEPELATRFMSEIRILAGLEHPNIAQLRTAFKVQNHFVMVMEYVEGVGLDKLAPQSQSSLDTLLDYGLQVLAALSYAHGRGVTHRDIKPANIMITSHGVVKLMDFGIAKSTTNDNLTRPGTTMGSIYYMSPEQVRGSTVDARSDIYSFGVTLYEMLTGKKPFEADTSYSVLNAQLNEAPVPPVQLNPALPPQLNTIVLRAMEKRPEDRFQTADEFRNALRALREPHVVQAIPQPMAQPQPTVETVPYSATQSFGQAVPQQAAQQVPQQGFTPVAVPVAAAQNSRKSHRTLWMGLGAAAVVLVLVALAAVLPRFYATHAGQNSNSATATQASVAASAPANTPSSAMASVAPPQTAAAMPQSNSPGASAPAAPASAGQANGASQTRPSPAIAASAAAGSGSRQPQAASQPAAQSTPAAAAAQPPAPSGPSPQEIRQARDRFTDLNARAQSAAAGVQQLRAQQQAQGLDIRGDILTAMNRMNSDMTEANQSLSQKDLDAAADYMNRADKEISTLEKFQGR